MNIIESDSSSSKWRMSLIKIESTVGDAIINLNKSSLKIVLVIDSNDTLIGTITDGDIRRGLLKGVNASSPIETIVKKDPLVVPPDMPRSSVIQLMKANIFNSIPIVDQNKVVVGLHLLSNLITLVEKSNTLVIMAGGKGKRLMPHTENCPKPLLPVDGKPMLEHIITKAKFEGFKNFVISIHYLGHMIEEYFEDGRKWGVKIRYLRENSPLGTAGALSLLSPSPSESIVVTNGDVMTDIQYGEILDFHINHENVFGTMAVRSHEWENPFGVVKIKGVDIIGFEEKPITRSHINAGVYVLEPESISSLIPGEYCDMPTLFMRLHEIHKRVIVYPMHEPWLDVGRLEDLNLINSKE